MHFLKLELSLLNFPGVLLLVELSENFHFSINLIHSLFCARLMHSVVILLIILCSVLLCII